MHAVMGHLPAIVKRSHRYHKPRLFSSSPPIWSLQNEPSLSSKRPACPTPPPLPTTREALQALFAPAGHATWPSDHATNLLLVGKFVQPRIKVLPPLEEHRVADKLEPGRELETGVLKQTLEFLGRDILRCLDFVGVNVKIDAGLDEENVVNWSGEGAALRVSPNCTHEAQMTNRIGRRDWRAMALALANVAVTYPRALPICRRWGPCSGCA